MHDPERRVRPVRNRIGEVRGVEAVWDHDDGFFPSSGNSCFTRSPPRECSSRWRQRCPGNGACARARAVDEAPRIDHHLVECPRVARGRRSRGDRALSRSLRRRSRLVRRHDRPDCADVGDAASLLLTAGHPPAFPGGSRPEPTLGARVPAAAARWLRPRDPFDLDPGGQVRCEAASSGVQRPCAAPALSARLRPNRNRRDTERTSQAAARRLRRSAGSCRSRG